MKITEIIKAYESNFESAITLQKEIDAIVRNISLILGVSKGRNKPCPKYKIHLAVDFYNLYFYLFPLQDLINSGKIENDYRNKVVISECLFSDFFDLKFLLLPHYEVEMDYKIKRDKVSIIRKKESLFYKIKRVFKQKADDIFKDDIFKTILEMDAKHLDEDFIQGTLKYIEEKYTDLFNLASLSVIDADFRLNNLKEKNRLLPIDKYNLSVELDEISIEKNGEEFWLRMLSNIRDSEDWRYSNYIDAQALSYITEINEQFRKKGKNEIIYLLTSSAAVRDTVDDAIAESGIGKIRLKNIDFEEKIAQNPAIALTALQFCQSPQINVETYENFCSTANILKDFLKYKNDISELKESGRTLTSYSDFLDWANRRFTSTNDLIEAWKNLNFAYKEKHFFNEINEELLLKTNTLLAKFEEEKYLKIKKLLEILSVPDIQDTDVYKKIQEIIGQIECDTHEIEFINFVILQEFANTRSPQISYMVNFQDPKVQELYAKVISREGRKLSRRMLNECEKKLFNMLFESKKVNFDAHLLYAYFLAKEEKYPAATRTLNKIKGNIGQNINNKDRYKFIENIVIAGKDKRLIAKAIQNCTELIERNPKQPRYFVQRGFFIWRGIRQEVKKFPYKRSDCLKDWKKARKLAKSQKEYESVLRIAVSNLVLFYFEENNYQQFFNYHDEFTKLQEAIPIGPVGLFLQSLEFWINAKKKKENEDKLKLLWQAEGQIKRAINAFPNPFYKEKIDELQKEISSIEKLDT